MEEDYQGVNWIASRPRTPQPLASFLPAPTKASLKFLHTLQIGVSKLLKSMAHNPELP